MLPAAFLTQLQAYRLTHAPASLKETQHQWAALSAAYRERKGQYTQKNTDHLAYILARMPATYAACEAVLMQAQNLSPPTSVLDVGSGPGTMGWALSQRPGGEMIRLSQVESDTAFVRFSQEVPPPIQARQTYAHFQGNIEPHDWVTMAYVLCELTQAQQAAWVDRAFSLATECIILIEPGTPAGYATLMRVRDQLLAKGVLAPCPHQDACPLQAPNWCHFSVRLDRTPEAKMLKAASLPYEDEKYSYLIVGRSRSQTQMPPAGARILRHPQPRTGHIHLDMCTPEGAYKKTIISAKSKAEYKKARSLKWGDSFSVEDAG